MAFLTTAQLAEIGFAHVGEHVLVSDKCSMYNPSRIRIGDRTRIDDFCILSAGDDGIEIGRNVHVACYVSLIGAGAITLEDFANLSSRVAIYSSNDDYSGEFLTNPTVAAEFTGVTHGPVTIGKHAIIGCGSVILPNVRIGEGAAVGALSLVVRDCEPFNIYAGVPVRLKKPRSKNLLKIEQKYLDSVAAGRGVDA